MYELALFAGAGGGILGSTLLGWHTVCAVEIEPYCREVLLRRQRDGVLPLFPIWDDIRTFDGRPWCGSVDIITGGFPCQDISTAGKGAGLGGEHSGLWTEMARIVGEVRPRYVFVENSPMLTSRGLGRVLGDLAALGFDARWGVVGAVHAGAPHKRERIWIVADAPCQRRQEGEGYSKQPQERTPCCGEVLADSDQAGRSHSGTIGSHATFPLFGSFGRRGDWWETEPNVGRVADGVANRVDRLKAVGNGQVPAVAALAWRILGLKQKQEPSSDSRAEVDNGG